MEYVNMTNQPTSRRMQTIENNFRSASIGFKGENVATTPASVKGQSDITPRQVFLSTQHNEADGMSTSGAMDIQRSYVKMKDVDENVPYCGRDRHENKNQRNVEAATPGPNFSLIFTETDEGWS